MKKVLLGLLTVYKQIFSPLLHQVLGTKSGCRNVPTCSEYAQEAINTYGAGKGLFLSVRRVLNCQPFLSV